MSNYTIYTTLIRIKLVQMLLALFKNYSKYKKLYDI